MTIFETAMKPRYRESCFVFNLTLLRERRSLGIALSPRSEVALVVASVGIQQGHLSHHAMIALVLMTLATAIIASSVIPVLANRLYPQTEDLQ
jgi:Kef-type K+ transport system membrane component KefB